jgi:hypothetical protein
LEDCQSIAASDAAEDGYSGAYRHLVDVCHCHILDTIQEKILNNKHLADISHQLSGAQVTMHHFTGNMQDKEQLEMSQAIKNSALENELLQLRAELKEKNEDLERDEEIFQDKVKVIKGLRKEIKLLQNDKKQHEDRSVQLQEQSDKYYSELQSKIVEIAHLNEKLNNLHRGEKCEGKKHSKKHAHSSKSSGDMVMDDLELSQIVEATGTIQ